jgi:hypothetical protein
MPMTEEQEGMPQHQHSPRAKHREDTNPQYCEEHLNDVARILAAHPPKTVERGNKSISMNEMLNADITIITQ